MSSGSGGHIFLLIQIVVRRCRHLRGAQEPRTQSTETCTGYKMYIRTRVDEILASDRT